MKKIFSLMTLTIIGAIAIATIQLWSSTQQPNGANGKVAAETPPPPAPVELKIFTPHSFDFTNERTSLTKNQLDQTHKIYLELVKKRAEMELLLATVNTSDATNTIYSPFRSLKIAEPFTRNGVIFYEIYFENLKQGTTMGPKTKAFLIKDFGSIENFKKNLMACASSARGWAITFYTIDNKRLRNYVLDGNDQNVPILAIPIIVLNMHEHAYALDYGTDRARHLNNIWDSIDWNVIEKRIIDWVLSIAPERQEKLVGKK